MVLINPMFSFYDGIIKGFDWHLPPLRFCWPRCCSKMSNKAKKKLNLEFSPPLWNGSRQQV